MLSSKSSLAGSPTKPASVPNKKIVDRSSRGHYDPHSSHKGSVRQLVANASRAHVKEEDQLCKASEQQESMAVRRSKRASAGRKTTLSPSDAYSTSRTRKSSGRPKSDPVSDPVKSRHTGKLRKPENKCAKESETLPKGDRSGKPDTDLILDDTVSVFSNVDEQKAPISVVEPHKNPMLFSNRVEKAAATEKFTPLL